MTPRNGYGFHTDGAEGVGACENYAAGRFDLSAYEAIRALVAEDRRQGVAGSRGPMARPPDARAARYARRGRRDRHRLVGPGRQARRTAGVPAARRCRPELPAYASTPELADVPAYLKHVSDLAELGYRAIKFHAWNVPDRDLEMLRAVHQEYGGRADVHARRREPLRPGLWPARRARARSDELPLVRGPVRGL